MCRYSSAMGGQEACARLSQQSADQVRGSLSEQRFNPVDGLHGIANFRFIAKHKNPREGMERFAIRVACRGDLTFGEIIGNGPQGLGAEVQMPRDDPGGTSQPAALAFVMISNASVNDGAARTTGSRRLHSAQEHGGSNIPGHRPGPEGSIPCPEAVAALN